MIRRAKKRGVAVRAASREQSSGIEQVNKAVSQMDQMTQQNAALVEEATAASQSVADQARALNGTIAMYRLDDTKPFESANARAPGEHYPAQEQQRHLASTRAVKKVATGRY